MGNLINGKSAGDIKQALLHQAKRWNGWTEGEMFKNDLALIKSLEAERDAALAKVPRWISVEERLPEEECLAVGWQHEILIGFVGKSGAGYACESEGEYLMDVTHWVPMPEPPEEDGE